jgi:hypothetical protein
LRRFRITSEQIGKQQSAVDAAQRYVKIAMSRYQSGLDPYLDVIAAKTTLLSDQQSQVTPRVSEMTAAVQLIQALGGGSQVNQLSTLSQVTSKAAATQSSGRPLEGLEGFFSAREERPGSAFGNCPCRRARVCQPVRCAGWLLRNRRRPGLIRAPTNG